MSLLGDRCAVRAGHRRPREDKVAFMLRAVLVIGLLWTHGFAFAQETTPAEAASPVTEAAAEAVAEAAAQTETTPKVTIPQPGEGDFDWIKFKNGEVLKGEIVELQDDSFVFDSDKLGKLTLDWEDIGEVISKKTNLLMFRDKSTVEGSFTVDTESVTVVNVESAADTAVEPGEPDEPSLAGAPGEADEATYPRSELRMIVPGGDRERNYWSGKLSLGMTGRRGNVDQLDIAGFVTVQRRDAMTRLLFEYNGAYSEVDSEKTADNHRANASYDIYLTERFYVRPAFLIAYRDPFQNIRYQLTPGAGLGYDIIDEGGIEWSAGGGIGWQYTVYQDPVAGADSTDNSFALLAGTRFKWEATSKIDLGFDFDITMPVPETDNFQFRAVAWTEIDVYGDLDLDIRFTWDRVNAPAPASDGTVPLPDDYRLYVGLGWEF